MSESIGNFKVLGVDLAAQPGTTACCEIHVCAGSTTARPILYDKKLLATDDNLLNAFADSCVKRIGIDSPFGWPVGFVGALSEYRLSNRWPQDDSGVYAGPKSKTQYRDLKYRATDLVVWHDVVRVNPLMVSVDKIGSVAIRNARLLARAESERTLEVDRSGRQGHFVEVYPAAAFAQWGIDTTGYKSTKKEGNATRRKVLRCLRDKMNNVVALGDELDPESKRPVTDHVVDAFVSAIIALMADLDGPLGRDDDDRLTEPIPPGLEATAKMEGWIVLPKRGSLERLKKRLKTRLGNLS